ncbi:MAG: TraR/DksA C4-type zinc finger protein [Alphaproteobacteria bacterium]|jgi:DnaK suppressor protein|nr:TraR/DksA C4-type zinc finger protein [Alphaproteobacteria bacterium]
MTKAIELPKGYLPSETEEFMNPMQLEYFKRKLVAHRDALIKETEETLAKLKQESRSDSTEVKDEVDVANDEAAKMLEIRIADRYRKLLKKIDAALGRIETGTYGYCIKSGDPIALGRLEAKPDATMSIESQIQHDLDKNDKV